MDNMGWGCVRVCRVPVSMCLGKHKISGEARQELLPTCRMTAQVYIHAFSDANAGVQGSLAHKNSPTPLDHLMTLGIVLL